MSASLRIREARPEEASHLSDLAMRSKAMWGYPPDFMEACREELAVTPAMLVRNSYHCFVAEDEGGIRGFHALEQLADGDCELAAMFVEPRHVGTGTGRALIEHAKRRATALGARRLIIQGDPNAVGFYRAAGGEEIGTLESGSIPGRYLPLFAITLGNETPAK
ncbi:MAG: GNAT family N-acetyltransferase [Arenicellales bacterium]|jgi:GNAT superfamily N-acetyltransferase